MCQDKCLQRKTCIVNQPIGFETLSSCDLIFRAIYIYCFGEFVPNKRCTDTTQFWIEIIQQSQYHTVLISDSQPQATPSGEGTASSTWPQARCCTINSERSAEGMAGHGRSQKLNIIDLWHYGIFITVEVPNLLGFDR